MLSFILYTLGATITVACNTGPAQVPTLNTPACIAALRDSSAKLEVMKQSADLYGLWDMGPVMPSQILRVNPILEIRPIGTDGTRTYVNGQ